MRKLLTKTPNPAIRTALVAAAVILAAAGAAQAAPDPGPRLVNTGGTQEVIRGPQAPGAMLGGAVATITGGGNDLAYQASPGALTAPATGRVGVVVNIGGNAEVAYGPGLPASPRAGG